MLVVPVVAEACRKLLQPEANCILPGELAPGHRSLGSAKLHKSTGRCGQWLVLAQSLVAMAVAETFTSRVRDSSCGLYCLWHLSLALAEVWPCYLWPGEVWGSLRQWSLAFVAGPGFFLDSLTCVVLAASDCLCGRKAQFSPWDLTSEAWAPAPSPHLPYVHADSVSN